MAYNCFLAFSFLNLKFIFMGFFVGEGEGVLLPVCILPIKALFRDANLYSGPKAVPKLHSLFNSIKVIVSNRKLRGERFLHPQIMQVFICS